MESVWQYFQCGYCQFGERFKMQLIKDVSSSTGRSKSQSKVYQSFNIQEACKFGDYYVAEYTFLTDQNDFHYPRPGRDNFLGKQERTEN